MILKIRKVLFENSMHNPAAPYIFLILCAYAVITTIYTKFFFDTQAMIMRIILGIIIILIFVIIERCPLNAWVTAFISPTLIAAVLLFGAFYFNGDGLLFSYLNCVTMISLSYFNTKGLALHIATVNIIIAVIIIWRIFKSESHAVIFRIGL